MTKKFTLTGGARIGIMNASYPLADLYVDEEMLTINASIVGNLSFQAKDIISIEPYTSIPLLGQGIKINHSVATYNPNLIFWTFKDPNYVISEIKATGFLQNLNSETSSNNLEIIQKQNEGGFPLKKSAAIFFGLAWNLISILGIFLFFTKGVSLAVGFLFISSILAIGSEKFRKIILKESRDLDDIKKMSYLLALISGLMLVAFSILKFE